MKKRQSGLAYGSGAKPFVARKTGSGYRLFLNLDVMRDYAPSGRVDRFITKLAEWHKKDNRQHVPERDGVVAINMAPSAGTFGIEIVGPAHAKVIPTKKLVISIAHYLGRYHFGLGDFVDSYVAFGKPVIDKQS